MHIRTGDTVVVLTGRDAGKNEKGERKTGKVLSVDKAGGKVIVEGMSMAKRHKKPRKEGDPGGIIKMETPIYASKVMRVCPKCSKPTRHAVKFTDKGKKVRVCKKCSAEI